MAFTRRKIIALSGPALALAAAGCAVTPTPDKQAASSAATAGGTKLLIASDLVQGSKNIPKEQAALKSCTLSSRFPRNAEMVWRVRVYDPKTGDLMDDKALKGVEVKLANGKTLEADYGAHPKDPPNEFYWTASWVVPKDNPTGTLKYTIAATAADGRSGDFAPFAVAASLPSILDDTLPDGA